MTGDSIVIQDSMESGKQRTDTINIKNNELYNNRRQGISIMAGKNIVIENNEIYKIKGNPPEAMLAIYNYVHERQINKSVAIKLLQEMYAK